MAWANTPGGTNTSATQLAAAGLDVHAFDLRGNGGSGGRRGHVDRWSQLHDDLAERLRAIRAAADGRPLVLYGHSMGGLIVLGYLLTDRPKPDLVVVTSPGLDSTLAGWKKALAGVLGRIAPTLSIPNGIDGSTLSRDPSVAERVAADPACARTSTTRFGAEGFAEVARVRRDYAGAHAANARPARSRRRPGAGGGIRDPGHAAERRAPDLSRASVTSSTTNPKAPPSSTR